MNRPIDPTTSSLRKISVWTVLLLALPVLLEQLLHTVVGFTDAYLANHLINTSNLTGDALASAKQTNDAAGAAVGSVSYVLWFVNHLAATLAIGATALVSRAIGANHRSLAHAVCGQVVTGALFVGIVAGTLIAIFAPQIAPLSNLPVESQGYFASYIRLLAFALPLTLLMLVASACLRGAGDTLSPMYALVTVDIVNVVMSVGLTHGYGPLPALGFDGIALGTVIAYICGGAMLFVTLIRGRGGIRLYLHRLKPKWAVLKRVLRIGLPGGAEMLLQWLANVGVLISVNSLGAASAAAHNSAIRLEAFSFLMGMAFSVAAATLVGQNLGRKDVPTARRAALYCYLLGGGIMTLWGVVFILFGPWLATFMSTSPLQHQLIAQCLFITGFIQCGFAAAIVFGGALRGAGDTKKVMYINLASIVFVRLVGVLIALHVFNLGLTGIWVILSLELFLRGCLMTSRFLLGNWYTTKV
jgi:putative MATE family efflux protein